MFNARALFVLVALAAAAIASPALAAEPAPPGYGAGAQFRIGVGARALAMGGASTAAPLGPETSFWNPASLPSTSLSVGGMYTEPFAGLWGGDLGISTQYLGAVSPFAEGSFGAGIGWFNVHVADIPYTENDVGFFDYSSSVFSASVGMREEIAEGITLSAGGSAKLYHERMLDGRATGLGWDLGLRVEFEGWQVAYCGQDVLGTRYRWRGTGQEPEMLVPWVHRFGVAAWWLEDTIVTAVDVQLEDDPASFRLGVEWLPIEQLALRGGARMEHTHEVGYRPVWTAGFGVTWDMFTLDAAYLRTPLPGFVGGEDLPTTDTYVLSVAVNL